MSLFEVFTHKDTDYYPNLSHRGIIREFSQDAARSYIEKYYISGKKQRVFDVDFYKKYERGGKHQHTVALYLLGCHLAGMVDGLINKHLHGMIDKLNHHNWYDFTHTWFLTALYHDIASIIESSTYTIGDPVELEFYLKKHDIKSDVYRHHWDTPNMNQYTFSEDIVGKYFHYRAEYMRSIDHGILAGYLLYDRLIKNYNEHWEKCKKGYPHYQILDDYNHFQLELDDHSKLQWCIGHQSLYAYIANAIIAHNIWVSNDEKLYTTYGLDLLIQKKTQKIRISEHPLVFFLDLLDTIEPIKSFSCVQPDVVWKAIDIDWDKELSITIDSTTLNADGWYRRIKSMEEWLAVSVSDKEINGNKALFTISIL